MQSITYTNGPAKVTISAKADALLDCIPDIRDIGWCALMKHAKEKGITPHSAGQLLKMLRRKLLIVQQGPARVGVEARYFRAFGWTRTTPAETR